MVSAYRFQRVVWFLVTNEKEMKIKEKEMNVSQTDRAALTATHTIDSAPQN
jgi:hypothetical protein